MIYLVSNEQRLFQSEHYKMMSVEESLKIISSWDIIQFDTETSGRDAHICNLLCAQFGSIDEEYQIVVDTTTVDIKIYKDVLESKVILGQNLKFDLQFLYKYGIVPRRVYDTMIAEQILYLGFGNDPSEPGFLSVSLHSIADRRLGIDLDKTVRSQIIWRGLDDAVVVYAANDVKFLYRIFKSQFIEAKDKDLVRAIKLENQFVPVIAYLEWSGIKLDINKWECKMKKDRQNLELSIKELNDFVIRTPILSKYVYTDTQGDLFTGFDDSKKVSINWASSDDVTDVCKLLGFNVNVKDKKTGEDKESAMSKVIKSQKGINDEFIRLYYGKGDEGDDDYFPGYSGSAKVVTSFGQGHLNAINPITGRIHTSYKQLGADTGRMSCGSTQINTDLAKLKGLPVKPSPKQRKDGLACAYPNTQQLPHDAETRACFIAEEGNMWVSCDYSSVESRLGADIYKETAMIEEYLYGSGDMHSLVAKMVFPELKDVPVKEIKKKYPHLRSKAKPIEFSQQFD